MNKIISIIRIAILLVLSSFAFIFLFGEEAEDCPILQILVDKALALAAFWYVGKLYNRWSKVDPWLKAYNKKCDDVMETPNPCHIED